MLAGAVPELNSRLSDYLNKVKAGTEVVITDRGKPVARLVPISRPRDIKESLTPLEKQGNVHAKEVFTVVI